MVKSSKNKTQHFSFRLRPADAVLVRDEADRAALKLAKYVSDAVLDRARRDRRDREAT